MSTFVLLPGAGGSAWYWSRVVPLLAEAGHEAMAIDLPGDDERAGLAEYARIVVDAVGDRGDVVVVAQSLGAFTAPLVMTNVRAESLIFVNAMIRSREKRPDTGGRIPGHRRRARRRRRLVVTETSTWPPTFCTTSRPRSSLKARPTSEGRPMQCSRRCVTSPAGPRYRRACSLVRRTDSFPSSFSAP